HVFGRTRCPARAQRRPPTWGFVAALRRDKTSGKRIKPKPATADSEVPNTSRMAATISIQESNVIAILGVTACGALFGFGFCLVGVGSFNRKPCQCGR